MAFPRAWNVLQHRYYIDDFYMRDIVLPDPRPRLRRA